MRQHKAVNKCVLCHVDVFVAEAQSERCHTTNCYGVLCMALFFLIHHHQVPRFWEKNSKDWRLLCLS